MPEKNILTSLFGALLLIFIALLLLTLGNDLASQVHSKIIFTAVLLGFLGLCLSLGIFKFKFSLPLSIYSGFFLFELLRAGYAFLLLNSAQESQVPGELLQKYIHAPVYWGCYFSVMAASYFFFCERTRIVKLFNTIRWTCFFIAMNGIPGLLSVPSDTWRGYLSDKIHSFYYPVFYFQPWVKDYILIKFFHPNYAGDVIAFGFFASLGLFLYKFFYATENTRQEGSEPVPISWGSFILDLMVSLVCAACVLLLFSRGTITFFGITIAFFVLVSLIKKPSRLFLTGTIVFFAGALIFLAWAGNFGKAVNEVSTLQEEKMVMEKNNTGLKASYSTNRAGIDRGLHMWQDHRVLGVGTRGYDRLAQKYSTPRSWIAFPLAGLYVVCHYVQMLAEEGAGAFIYFLFLLAYLYEILMGIFRTRSRFRWIAGLTLCSAVLLVYSHATVSFLMENYSLAMLVSATMGASLSVFRKDFDVKAEPSH